MHLPRSISKGMGGWLITVKRKRRKLPFGHVNERFKKKPEKPVRGHMCSNDLPWLPSQTITELLSQVKFRSSKSLAENPYYQGTQHNPFVSENSCCLLLLSLKRENFPSPRKWHIRVKNPIKEQ